MIISVQMSTFSFIDVVVLVNLIWNWLKCIIFYILCLTESKSTSSTTWGQISSFLYFNFTQRRFCANRNNHATYQEGQETSSKKYDKKSKSSSEAPVVATKITEVSAILSSTSLQETATRVKIRSTPNSSVENIPKSTATEQSSAASIKGEILFSSKYQIYSYFICSYKKLFNSFCKICFLIFTETSNAQSVSNHPTHLVNKEPSCFSQSRLDLPLTPLIPQFSNHSFIYDEKGLDTTYLTTPPEPAPLFPYERPLRGKTRFQSTRSISSDSISDSRFALGSDSKTLGRRQDSRFALGSDSKTLGRRQDSRFALGSDSKTLGRSSDSISDSRFALGSDSKNLGRSSDSISDSRFALGSDSKTLGRRQDSALYSTFGGYDKSTLDKLISMKLSCAEVPISSILTLPSGSPCQSVDIKRESSVWRR